MENFYHDLPVLVTGGCGFIGSHVAQKLVELGAKVTIIDDLSTGSLNNIESFRDKITLITRSILDKDAVNQATLHAKIIFHLAAFISVPDSLRSPSDCYAINVDGTINMLEAARKYGIERFVFSSSAAVYGPTESSCTENSSTNPTSPYGYSKLIGELLCTQYTKNFGINTVMLRYFNVWGERQNPHAAYAAVVAQFMHQIKQNAPITIFGDGQQTRDFVHVSKVVEANLMLGMHARSSAGNSYNIATGKSITLLELIEQLKKDFPDYTSTIKFEPARLGDIKHSAADCSKYITFTQNL